MKKLLIVFSLVLTIFSISGCGNKEPQPNTNLNNIISKDQLVVSGFVEIDKSTKLVNDAINYYYQKLLKNDKYANLKYITNGNNLLIGYQNDQIVIALNFVINNLMIADNNVSSGSADIFFFTNTPMWGEIYVDKEIGIKGKMYAIKEQLDQENNTYEYVNSVDLKNWSTFSPTQQKYGDLPIVKPDFLSFLETYFSDIYQNNNLNGGSK